MTTVLSGGNISRYALNPAGTPTFPPTNSNPNPAAPSFTFGPPALKGNTTEIFDGSQTLVHNGGNTTEIHGGNTTTIGGGNQTTIGGGNHTSISAVDTEGAEFPGTANTTDYYGDTVTNVHGSGGFGGGQDDQPGSGNTNTTVDGKVTTTIGRGRYTRVHNGQTTQITGGRTTTITGVDTTAFLGLLLKTSLGLGLEISACPLIKLFALEMKTFKTRLVFDSPFGNIDDTILGMHNAAFKEIGPGA